MRETLVIKEIIQNYASFSGQKVNIEKSKIFFLNTPQLIQNRLLFFWHFEPNTLPCTYLGILFFIKHDNLSFWDKIISVISKRILSWNHRWLSLARKIVLIKSILNAVPIYLMLVLKSPKDVLVSLQDSLRSFLWSSNKYGRNKLPLVAWDKVCLLKDLGGTGIRNLEKQNLALGAKLVWNFYEKLGSLWAQIMFAKYLNNGPREYIFQILNLPSGSVMWNFICKCRYVILPNLSWILHNGTKVRFWGERWNGHPPLRSLRNWSPLISILSSLWGTFVAYYFDILHSGNVRLGKWKSIDFFGY